MLFAAPRVGSCCNVSLSPFRPITLILATGAGSRQVQAEMCSGSWVTWRTSELLILFVASTSAAQPGDGAGSLQH